MFYIRATKFAVTLDYDGSASISYYGETAFSSKSLGMHRVVVSPLLKKQADDETERLKIEWIENLVKENKALRFELEKLKQASELKQEAA